MKLIYKISLIIAFFLATASFALASFNYDSANNHFFINSVFKIQGDNILIGDALDEVPDAFAISNNLIFLYELGEFNSGFRKINKRALSTPKITINNANQNFLISSIGGNQGLNFMANAVTVNQDLYTLSGLNLSEYDIGNKTIATNRILATNLYSLSSATILAPKETIFLTEAGPIEASVVDNKIIFNGKDFCVTKTWDAQDNFTNATIWDQLYYNNAYGYKSNAVFDSEVAADLDPTTACYDSTAEVIKSKKTCCPKNYFVFDLNAVTGKMVCCQAASEPLQMGNVTPQ